MTAEKQAPSPIDILGAMKEAVAIEKRLAKAGVSKALRDVLSRCVGEYNKMVSKRSHKIDTPTKNLVMNMFLEQNTIDLLLLLVFSSMMFNGIKWCSTEIICCTMVSLMFWGCVQMMLFTKPFIGTMILSHMHSQAGFPK